MNSADDNFDEILAHGSADELRIKNEATEFLDAVKTELETDLEDVSGLDPADFSFVEKNSLGMFCCPHCEYESERRHNVVRHFHRRHRVPCGQCDALLHSEEALNEHLGSVHGQNPGPKVLAISGPDVLDDRKFSCHFCDFKCDRQSAMKGHMQRCHTFECEDCDETFHTTRELTSHVKDQHSGDATKIPTKTSARAKRSLSEAGSSAKPLFACSECSYVSDRKNNVSRHVDKVHRHLDTAKRQKTDDRVLVQCPFKGCNEKSSSEDDSNLHLLVKHNVIMRDGVELQVCHRCCESFDDRQTLLKHNEKEHRSEALQKTDIETEVQEVGFESFIARYDENRFDCKNKQCHEKFISRQELDKHHLKEHHMLFTGGSYVYVCPHCDFSDMVQRRLTHHIKTDHPENTDMDYDNILPDLSNLVLCAKPNCEDVFESQETMERHLILEHQTILKGDTSIYICVYCHYQNHQHSKMLKHIEKSHTNDPKSQTQLLLEDPTSNFQEIVHQLLAPKLVCRLINICSQRFITQEELNDHHLKDHNMICQDGVYYFVCPYPGCQFSTGHNRFLTSHLEKIHNKPKKISDVPLRLSPKKQVKHVFRCRKCNFECKIQSMFENHLFYSNHDVSIENSKMGGSISSTVFTPEEQDENEKVLQELFDEFFPLDCKDCQIKFRSCHELAKHERDVHGVEKCLTCSICQKKYKSRTELVQHLCAAHYNRKPFQCLLCNFCTSYRKKLELHKQKYHHGSLTGNSKNSSLLKRAKKTLRDLCNKMVPRECKDCALYFESFHDLMTHCKEDHGREDILKCSFCNKQHQTRSGLVQHVMSSHTEQKPFTCGYQSCNFSTSFFSKLKKHLSEHEMGLMTTADKSEVVNQTMTPDFLKRLCDRVMPLTCTRCPEEVVFTDFRKLSDHDKNVHGIESLVCKECGRRFRSRPDLAQHIAGFHLDEKPFECHLCTYKARLLKHLAHHLEAHARGVVHKTNENPVLQELCERLFPLECQECSVTFKNIRVQLEHERTVHGEERALNCPKCKKRFQARSVLAQHYTRHTGEKPFKCKKCEFASSFIHLLERHEKKHK